MNEELKGVTIFEDGRWLIQKSRNKKTITRRGHGGEREARKALREIEADLNEYVETHKAAQRLGVPDEWRPLGVVNSNPKQPTLKVVGREVSAAG